MLQAALEDFAANHGFREFHDFDELLPDVLAASAVDIFVGEARARATSQTRKPGHASAARGLYQRTGPRRAASFEHAMLAVCVDTQTAAEQWSMELTRLIRAAALVIGTPFSITEQGNGAWVAAGIVTSRS